MTINDIIDLHEQKDGSFAEDASKPVVDRVSEYMNNSFRKVHAAAAAAGLALLIGAYAPEARADPVMEISVDTAIGEYDWMTPVDNPNAGQEMKFTYIVKNISPENIDDNNLIQLRLPGGTQQGVYYAKDENDSWNMQIMDDYTLLTGNGEFIDVNREHQFDQYTSRIDGTLTKSASAVAAGDASGTLDFNPVDVTSPIPEPATGLLMGAALGVAYFVRKLTRM